jgi:hypothetical protein
MKVQIHWTAARSTWNFDVQARPPSTSSASDYRQLANGQWYIPLRTETVCGWWPQQYVYLYSFKDMTLWQ